MAGNRVGPGDRESFKEGSAMTTKPSLWIPLALLLVGGVGLPPAVSQAWERMRPEILQTSVIVTLTPTQQQLGFGVGEETFQLTRVGPDTYRGTIKWRGTGRQPWWAPITLTVKGNGMSPDGWARLP